MNEMMFTTNRTMSIIRPSRPSFDVGGVIMQVNIYEAKTHFTELIDKLETENEIIIARRGKPVAKLVPLDYAEKRPVGTAKGKFTVPATTEEFDKSNDEIADLFGV